MSLSVKQKVRRAFTLVEIMIVVLIIGILLAIAVPNFVRARESSRAKACVANLKQIDSGKEQFAMDTKLASTSTAAIVVGDLVPAYIKATPACPSSGTYAYGNPATTPACTGNGGGTTGTYNYHGL